MNGWQPNVGTIPEGITEKTKLRVRYRDGYEGINDHWRFDRFWQVWNDSCDIMEWRVEQ